VLDVIEVVGEVPDVEEDPVPVVVVTEPVVVEAVSTWTTSHCAEQSPVSGHVTHEFAEVV